MTNGVTNIESSYRIEIIRKAIHFCSLSIPIFYYFVSKEAALAVFVPLMIGFLIVDIARYHHGPTQQWFYRTFGWILRRRESNDNAKRLNGATYVLIAATLTVLIFPKIIAVTSFAILIIGDLNAALIGRRYGKHKFLGKSLEGSIGFFVSGLLVVALGPKLEYRPEEYLIGIAAVAIGAIAEAASIEVDDNLSIPLAAGATLWAGYSLLLPSLNIYSFG